MNANDVYAKITEQIVSQLEAGLDESWSACWHTGFGQPSNASTGVAYRGGNVLVLWASQLVAHWPTMWWATYRQWSDLGRQVQKGEKATHGVKWIEPKAKAGADPEKRRGLVPVGFAVFNVAQTEVAEGFPGTPWEPPSLEDGPAVLPRCEAFFAAIGASIIEGQPAYSPITDQILMPPIGAFHDSIGYYATLAHEHAHWTGHSSRLDRTLGQMFGTPAYADEELVAELAAAFVCAHLGISTEPRPDHAQYLGAWIKRLRSDPKALFTAASAAQKAADFLTAAAERPLVTT